MINSFTYIFPVFIWQRQVCSDIALMNEMQLNYDKNQNMESGNEAEAPQPATNSTFRHKKWCNRT